MDDLTPEQIQHHAAASQRAMYHAPKPKQRAGQTPEAKVSKAVEKYLTGIGCLVHRANAGFWRDASGHVIRGMSAGTADFIGALPNAVFLAVECKATTGTTLLQRRYLDRVTALGGVAIVVHSVEELRAGLVAAFGESVVAGWEASRKTRQR